MEEPGEEEPMVGEGDFDDLPEFANEHNQEVHAEIQLQQKRYAAVEADFEECLAEGAAQIR